jgi:Uncharacterised protein family (UPF0236)
MKRTREQIKAELMKKAEQEIDRLLDWEEKVDKPTLTQFENPVLMTRKALSEAMRDGVMAGQETHRPAEPVMCPKCGQPTENKGLQTKEVETRAGTLRLRRQYHYCAHCQVGFFPLDEQLQLWEVHWSEGGARLVVWLSGQATFGEASEILAEVGQIHVSTSTVWRQAQRWGEALKAIEQQQADKVHHLPSREEMIPGEATSTERMGEAMDGAKMYVLGEGWKEFKVGCLFEIVERPTIVKGTLEWEVLGHAVHNTYVAHLGGPEVLGDGATWIWNLADEHFYDSLRGVDWYHGTEHLAHAAESLYGEDSSPVKQRWLNEHKQVLFEGQALPLGQTLRDLAAGKTGSSQDDLLEQAGYFENNQHRMNYMELREDGWLIGSGMVESGAKQFKDRFTGPGMRWSRPGAERLLPIRAAVMSRTFDDAWRAIYKSPNN